MLVGRTALIQAIDG